MEGFPLLSMIIVSLILVASRSLLMSLIIDLSITILILLASRSVSPCPHGEIRLVDVTAAYQGTLEVCMAGRWSAVCGNRDSAQEATVACRQLGCERGDQLLQSSCSDQKFRFNCSGLEANLISCDVTSSSTQSWATMCIVVRCEGCPSVQGLLPHGNASNDSQVASSLDAFSGVIGLKHNFIFFGSQESNISVNSHGVISFQERFPDFNQVALPINNTVPLILLYWTDTDLSRGGALYYRETTDSEILALARSLVFQHNNYSSNFIPKASFITTWRRVRQTGVLSFNYNTYQAVLITDDITSYVCLLYEDVQWPSTSFATIGFNAGDGRSFTVPGSGTSETLNMESRSNIGQPGVFVYQVDGNEIRPLGVSILKPPTQLMFSQISQTSLKLRWTANGTGHYNVYCYQPTCPYCLGIPTPDILQTPHTNATISGLTPFTLYECCVTKVSSGKESKCSERIRNHTLPVSFTELRNITVTFTETTSLTLAWSRLTESYELDILSYIINCTSIHHSVEIDVVNGTSVSVQGLMADTNYTCCVVATSSVGLGSQECIIVMTNKEHQQTISNEFPLTTAISAGAVVALTAVLLVVITSLTICCCYNKRKSKHQQSEHDGNAAEVVSEVTGNSCAGGGQEMKEKSTNNDYPDIHPNRDNRHEYNKGDVEIRYERPVIRSVGGAMTQANARKTMNKGDTLSLTPNQQNTDNKVYQPLIPPKTYKATPEDSAYQDLSFETREQVKEEDGEGQSLYEPVERSERESLYEAIGYGRDEEQSLYEAIGQGEGVSQYQPLTFGDKRAQEESNYQPMPRGEENQYEIFT